MSLTTAELERLKHIIGDKPVRNYGIVGAYNRYAGTNSIPANLQARVQNVRQSEQNAINAQAVELNMRRANEELAEARRRVVREAAEYTAAAEAEEPVGLPVARNTSLQPLSHLTTTERQKEHAQQIIPQIDVARDILYNTIDIVSWLDNTSRRGTIICDIHNKRDKLILISRSQLQLRQGRIDATNYAIYTVFYNQVILCAVNRFINGLGLELIRSLYYYLETGSITNLTGVTNAQQAEIIDTTKRAWASAYETITDPGFESIITKKRFAKNVLLIFIEKLVQLIYRAEDKSKIANLMDHISKTPSCSTRIYIVSSYLLYFLYAQFDDFIPTLSTFMDKRIRQMYAPITVSPNPRGFGDKRRPITPFSELPSIPTVDDINQLILVRSGGYRRTRRQRQKSRKNRRHH